jgi:trans-aconitate methyltransferase
VSDVDGWDTQAHYGRLAASYEHNWAYGEAFLDWMTREIIAVASITADDRIADVGCGTGLFTRRVLASVKPSAPILCVDPSDAMLDQLQEVPGLTRLRASAEVLATATGHDSPAPLDVITMKEAVHHIPAAERASTLAGLAGLLAPGGRLLVVMLPATLDYPLFDAALRRFEELQPDPADIERHLSEAGLTTSLTYGAFELELPKERYLSMVRERYMSLLSMFDDDEIEDGIAEIEQQHPEPVLRFPDGFAFVLGVRGGTS